MRDEKKTALKEVKVSKAKLIKKLKANRTAHIRDYKKALAGYRRKLTKALNALAKKAMSQAKKVPNLPEKDLDQGISPHEFFGDLQKPRSYDSEYERAIQMLTWSEEATVTLSANDFNCYVLDQWQWRDQFYAAVIPNSGR